MFRDDEREKTDKGVIHGIADWQEPPGHRPCLSAGYLMVCLTDGRRSPRKCTFMQIHAKLSCLTQKYVIYGGFILNGTKSRAPFTSAFACLDEGYIHKQWVRTQIVLGDDCRMRCRLCCCLTKRYRYRLCFVVSPCLFGMSTKDLGVIQPSRPNSEASSRRSETLPQRNVTVPSPRPEVVW